ncbi:MAG TPA: hypothetical protein VGW14_08605, partial [Thermoleophilaceae bacterium]|nr:hypothetical protein [Thermoleophilaceae bacterium]
VKLAQGLVGGGEEPVAESRPAPPAQRRRTSSRSRPKSGNGRARSGAAAKRPSRSRAKQATKAAPPIDEPASAAAKEAMQAAPPIDAPASAAAAEDATRAAPPIDEPASAAAAAPSPLAGETADAGSGAPQPEPVAEPRGADGPTHVSEEPELVVEVAESGAEDGAGAEVAVDEPWPSYDEMNAPDIEDRLLTEGPETAAAVSLYEASHKGRTSIIEAASRTMMV